jgi:hypothetical protein
VDDFDPGWVAEDHYRMLSLSFTVRSTDERFAEALAWHLAPFRRATPEVQAFPVDLYVQEKDLGSEPTLFSLFLANTLRFTQYDLGDVLAHAVWMLHAEVSARTRDFVLLHAGAVARDGAALVLPAKPEAGKSTLVLALLRRGFTYLSDELAAIDPVTERVYPFEKRIGLDSAALELFADLGERLEDRRGLSTTARKRHVRPEDVGASVSGPVSPRSIVFVGGDRSGPPVLTPISKAESVRRMAEHSTNLYRYADRGVILLARVAEQAQTFELTGGTTIERAELLDESPTLGR